MRTNKGKKVLIGLFILAGILLLPYIVMLLWNGILPAVIGVKAITYWQAVGIFILSKILFGGPKFGGPNHKRNRIKQHFKERFMNMSPEEREAFQQKWKERCGNHC